MERMGGQPRSHVEGVNEQEKKLIESATAHLKMLQQQIEKTRFCVSKYQETHSSEAWDLMLGEMETLSALQSIPPLQIRDMKHAHETEVQLRGWPRGTDRWAK